MADVDLLDRAGERAVLGAALLEPAEVSRVAEVPPEVWTSERHKALAQLIRDRARQGEPVDVGVVRTGLLGLGLWDPATGDAFLATLLEEAALPTSLPAMIAHLVELAGRRAALRVAQELQARAGDVTVPWASVLDRATADLAGIERGEREGYLLPGDWAAELRAGRDLPRLLTGLPIWDQGGGLTYGDLHLLAARPGLGKTLVAIQIAHHVSHVLGLPLLFISAEMSRVQIGRRLQRLAGLDGLADSGFLIADPAGPSVQAIAQLVRRAHAHQAIQLVIVDHVQEVHADRLYRERRDLEIREITLVLRDLVKRLGIVGLCLSQLNREVEHRRTSPKPILSDLRDGGALEEQAATVTFLYTTVEDTEADPLPVKFAVRKNRHGRLLDWEGELWRQEGRIR